MIIAPKLKSKTLIIKQVSKIANFKLAIFVFAIVTLLASPFISLSLRNTQVTATHNSISFATAVNYTTGNSPGYDLPTGPVGEDFNNDDNEDIAMIAASGNNVSILIGNGDGTFDAVVNYPVGNSPIHVATGDFNEDTYIDLATTNNATNNVSILINNGDGTFAAAVNYALGISPYSPPRLADFNNDNHLDIASSSYVGNSVTILIGNGDGTFDAVVSYGAGDPYDFRIDDFNEDDYPDIITVNNGTDNVSVLINDGDGTFAAAVNYAVGDGPYMGIALTDLNDDTFIDAVVSNGAANSISVLIGNGDGTFDAKVDYAAGTGPYAVSAGDLNNDDNVDIVVNNYNGNTVAVLIGNGDGTLDAAVTYATGLAPYNAPITEEYNDYNLDGNIDLIGVNYSSDTISILAGNGDGTFDAKTDYAVGDQPDGPALARDFNEDGLPDLAIANIGTDDISILINNTAVPTVGFDLAVDDQSESVAAPEFPVVLSVASDVDVTVNYTVTGGTATGGGVDYTLASGTLTITAGETQELLPLTIVDDALEESMETIIVTLSSPTSAILDSNNTTETYYIVDNDTPTQTSSSGSSSNNSDNDSDQDSSTESCIGYTNTDSCLTQAEYTPGMIINPSNAGQDGSGAQESPAETFLRNLGIGSVGDDVKLLQQFLNNNGYILAATGFGSIGNETTYYGPRTSSAITKFQEFYRSQILTPLGLFSGTGYFGEKTRAWINQMVR